MILLPIGTDAPIYHWPIATVGLIVLNTALLFAIPPPPRQSVVDDEDEVAVVERGELFNEYALRLGHGIHPIQWVTHNFLHYDIAHLIGNMIFLWAFGIVVEGKLGIVRFLAAYVAIGTCHGAFTQILLLGSGMNANAAGASAVIFGLLAICMFWAPYNEVNAIFVFFFMFRMIVKQVDLRYTWLAIIYVGEQILFACLRGLRNEAPIAELGHLSGAFWGSAIGFVMLKKDWVDCEGWDLFSRGRRDKKLAKDWKRREERLDRASKSEKKALKKRIVSEEISVEDRSANALNKVRKLIEMGDFASALTAYDKSARTLPNWPAGPELMELIKAMHSLKAESESLPLMRDYCRKHPETASRVQLKMAQVLIRQRERPTQGLRVLSEISEAALPANLQAVRRQLIEQAEAMQEDGVLELEGDE